IRRAECYLRLYTPRGDRIDDKWSRNMTNLAMDSLQIPAMMLTEPLLKRITQHLLEEIFRTQLAEQCQIAHTVQKHHNNHFHQVHNQNETSPSIRLKCTLPDIPELTQCQSMNQTDTPLQKSALHEHQTRR